MSEVETLIQIRELATGLIGRFMTTAEPEALQALSDEIRPREEDYAAVFDEMLAARAPEFYAPLWAHNPVPKPSPERSAYGTIAAYASQFRTPPIPQGFPGGFERIGRHLDPNRIWVTWRCMAPGRRAGTRFDGLVWMGDRFAWFPKPWRIVPHVPQVH